MSQTSRQLTETFVIHRCFLCFQLDSSDNAALDEGRRASWLETRDLENDFKDLVFLTLQEVSIINSAKVLHQCLKVRDGRRVLRSEGEKEGREKGDM